MHVYEVFSTEHCAFITLDRIQDTYRVSDPSCHPKISLCARIQKKNRFQDLPPPKNGRVPNSGKFRGGKSWTLPFLGVPILGLCFFLDSSTVENLGVARRIRHPVGQSGNKTHDRGHRDTVTTRHFKQGDKRHRVHPSNS